MRALQQTPPILPRVSSILGSQGVAVERCMQEIVFPYEDLYTGFCRPANFSFRTRFDNKARASLTSMAR